MKKILGILLINLLFICDVSANINLIEKCADRIFEDERRSVLNRWYRELGIIERCSGFFKPKDCPTPYNKKYVLEKIEYWSKIQNKPLKKKMRNVSYPNYIEICKFDFKNNKIKFFNNLSN